MLRFNYSPCVNLCRPCVVADDEIHLVCQRRCRDVAVDLHRRACRPQIVHVVVWQYRAAGTVAGREICCVQQQRRPRLGPDAAVICLRPVDGCVGADHHRPWREDSSPG